MQSQRLSQGAEVGMRRFPRGERGAVTLESALAIVALLGAFAIAMEIVHTCWAADRMGRAARAAARSLALDVHADPCAAVRRELAWSDDASCDRGMTIVVDPAVGPEGLPAELDGEAGAGTGDLVLVRIAWTRRLLPFGRDASDPEGDDDWRLDPGSRVSFGVARREPAA